MNTIQDKVKWAIAHLRGAATNSTDQSRPSPPDLRRVVTTSTDQPRQGGTDATNSTDQSRPAPPDLRRVVTTTTDQPRQGGTDQQRHTEEVALWLYQRCVDARTMVNPGSPPAALDLALSILRCIPRVTKLSHFHLLLMDETMTPPNRAERDVWRRFSDFENDIFRRADDIKMCTEDSIRNAASLADTARTLTFSPALGPEDRDTAARRGRVAAMQTPAHPPGSPDTTGHGGGGWGSWSDDGDWRDFSEEELIRYASGGSGKMTRTQRRTFMKALQDDGGSKFVRNADARIVDIKRSCGLTGVKLLNDRTCLQDAIWHLTHDPRVIQALYDNMPSLGDTTIERANDVLKRFEMKLVPVSRMFITRVPAKTAHNIVKVRSCKLIVRLKLYPLKHRHLYAKHFLAWDGTHFYEDERKLRINNTTDRVERHATDIFNRLYHPTKFRAWEITAVFQIVRTPTTSQNVPTSSATPAPQSRPTPPEPVGFDLGPSSEQHHRFRVFRSVN